MGTTPTYGFPFPDDTDLVIQAPQQFEDLADDVAAGLTEASSNASLLTTGTVPLARIPNLPASQTTSGTFADARIPNLNASKITAGVLDIARIPNAAKAGIGSNVVQTVKTDVFTTTSASFVTVTGLTATITPTSATAKILIIAQVAYSTSQDNAGQYRLAGGNAGTYIGDAAGTRTRAVFGGRQNVDANKFTTTSDSIVYLDSPGTASAVTYEVQCRAAVGLAVMNRDFENDDSAQRVRGASSITVIEVAA